MAETKISEPVKSINGTGKNSGIGEKHLAVRGYTGVGYDRHAAVNGENGGTPGYSKDAVKGDKSNWANQVSISEIMLVTEEGEGSDRVPRATRLPQWFEIYNASLTEAVSINNWYLEDPERRYARFLDQSPRNAETAECNHSAESDSVSCFKFGSTFSELPGTAHN